MSITAEERRIAGRLGFPTEIVAMAKREAGEDAVLSVAEHGSPEEGTPDAALIVSLSRERSESVLEKMRTPLVSQGYMPFLWDATFEFEHKPDSIAVLKTSDSLAPK